MGKDALPFNSNLTIKLLTVEAGGGIIILLGAKVDFRRHLEEQPLYQLRRHQFGRH